MANYYTWTDDPVVSETKIRGPHWSELATNMKKIRGYMVDFGDAYGADPVSLGDSGAYTSPPFDFDPNLGVPEEKVKADHANSLRVALDAVNSAWAVIRPGWSWCRQYSNSAGVATDNRVTANLTKIRNVHVNELRRQLDLVDGSMYTFSPFCPTACQVSCQLTCQVACEYSCQGCNNSTCHDQMCGYW